MREAVETAEVQRKVKRPLQIGQVGYILDAQFGAVAGSSHLAPGTPDRQGREVDPCHLPAILGQGQHVRPSPTAEVDCPSWRVVFDERHQFGRRDAAVPRRSADEITPIEEQPTPHDPSSDRCTSAGSTAPAVRQSRRPSASRKMNVGVYWKPYRSPKTFPAGS